MPDVRARIAWLLAVVTVVFVAVDVVISAQAVPLLSETAIAVHGFPFVHGAVVGSAIMGALIISRYDRHPIGWLLALVGVASAFSLLTEAYAYWVQESDGPGPPGLAGTAAWLSALTGGQLAIAGLALMFLLAPDGHLYSRRWRYVAWVVGIGEALCFLAVLSMDPTTFELVTQSDDVGLVRGLMLTFGFIAISIGLVASVVSVLKRLRQSSGEQRQQLRLIALSVVLIAGAIVFLFVAELFVKEQTWLSSTPLFVAYFLLPILFATAVLRYRLYDLDLIINRTLVVAAGVVFAAVGYTVLVVTVGRQVEGRTSGFWLSLLGTAIVALAFQPLRRSVVRLANRMAYGERAQPYEALADFSRDLARSPSPDTLLPAVAEAAGRAVSARGAAATLDAPGAEPVTATWGSLEEAPWQLVPVQHDGVDLGSIAVVLPRGRALRPSDGRLLQALADQTAIAFRNTALAAQLAAHVAELDRTTYELAESRRRIIEADDAARRALEATIGREVLPHLVGLPDDIRRERAAVRSGSPTAGIGRLVESTNTALESLRELTRGVFPTQLSRSGVEPALRSQLARGDRPVTLTVSPDVAGVRFPARVEAAVYFCATAAIATGDAPAAIDLGRGDDTLVLTVRGVADVDRQGHLDRVEAVGGTLDLTGDVLVVTVPVGDAASTPADGSPSGRSTGDPSGDPASGDPASGDSASAGVGPGR